MTNIQSLTDQIQKGEQSESANKFDSEMQVQMIEVAKIYSDPVFNCRGQISPLEVIDLAKSIAQHGLQQPAVVRPRGPDTPPGYDFSLVMGHMRHRAYQVNGTQKMPCVIRTDLTDFQARTLNAIENLKRHTLNPVQEARTVRPYHDAGWTREEIAKTLGMSNGWVQIRIMILELPEEIQQAVAAGFIGQTQIRDLHSLKHTPEKQMELAKKIKEAKERGDKRGEQLAVQKATVKPETKRHRKKFEIFEMMQHIYKQAGGASIATRALAWAAGEINDFDLYKSIKEYCDDKGIDYEMPDPD